MIDYNYLKGKKIALIIWNIEDENDVRVFLGEITEKNNAVHFINPLKGWDVALDSDKLSEIKQVSEDMKGILLDADYCLSVTLGTLPNDSTEDFLPTGLKWT